jgi:hypothetical protein
VETASPIVAGVAAYLLSLDMYQEELRVPGQVAARVRDLLMDLSWPRMEGGAPVVWNRATFEEGSCSRRRERGKRQAANSGLDSCSGSATTSSTTTTTPAFEPPDVATTTTTTKAELEPPDFTQTTTTPPSPDASPSLVYASCPPNLDDIMTLNCLAGVDQIVSVAVRVNEPGHYVYDIYGACCCTGEAYSVTLYWPQGVNQTYTLDINNNSVDTAETEEPCLNWALG